MEFIIFLSKLDKEILDLLLKANYIIEENKVECLANKEIKGLHNFKENKTERVIRKALRHEATHAIQKCNNNRTIGNIKDLESKLHSNKRKALNFSALNFAGTYAKEVEAYILEDKPRKVRKMLEKYCL